MMAIDYVAEVQKLYVAYFSRPADPAGLAYWTNILEKDPNGYQQMAATFSATNEYRLVFAGMDNRAIIAEVYDNLFGRPAEQAGVDYWVGQMATGRITIDNVVTQVAAGSQNNDRLVLNGKVAVAESFTSHVDTQAERTAYSGAAANKIAIDYLAGIKSLDTIAMHMDPGNIDATIARIVGTPSGLGFDEMAVA
ncbi:DUF4214 domain-containing protein [Massilia sp. IC2-477]|uniref:DUF4214 domain-containing protein n=1 Tax=unclassified Massilia TaxID=2609279 RepID=UPI001D123CC6|nr:MULTISPECIES: DUF4214 domain-containing protein [unclassified Massilia]MCC2958623.1 DUF4214 domain-containing protein [Massilia sp. IC2-477]MCC2971130.1 DUF4214 domain-containing protein [Massilia sp. IC2-476]